MDEGSYVITWANRGVFGVCGPEVRRFKSATEVLRYLGRDWPQAKRPDNELPVVWQAMFVSRREIRV